MDSSKIKKAVKETLVYADLFSYPLKKEELWKWLIWEEKIPVDKNEFETWISKKPNTSQKFYYLPKRENIIAQRKQRKEYSKTKQTKVKKIASLLQKIPTVKLIGVSGTLAMENTKKNDDIDLFLITQKNTLWITRLLAVLLLEVLGIRRRPNEVMVNDKICLNMLMDENSLTLPPLEQNLYTAHEVCQMIPLWDKDNTYDKFLLANQWVKKYLPNALPKTKRIIFSKKNLLFSFLDIGYWILDILCMFPQLWYMQKRRTREITTVGMVRFHPLDRSSLVLKSYRNKLSSKDW